MKKVINKLKPFISIKRVIYVSIAIYIAFCLPIQMMNKQVSANSIVDELQTQINALESQITQYHAEATKLNSQVQTLKTALAKLSSEKAIIQAGININQAKYDQLVIQIVDTEKKIQDNKDALGKIIADLYVGDKITPIEMIASSKNLSDYMDKQEYRNSIRDELTITIKSIEELKVSLDKQKVDVEFTLNEQKNARQALANKEAEQSNLIAQTKNQESAYQKLVAEGINKKQDLVQQQQAAIIAAQVRAGGTVVGISDPSKGNYPWGGNNCYIKQFGDVLVSYGGINGDGSDALGYACRQCTSYAAWKILEYTGRGYRNLGNAGQWPYSFDPSMVHQVARRNSVGVIGSGYYGHVVWVESDPDADGYIIISQYNHSGLNTGDNTGLGWGKYSKARVKAATYGNFIYF